MAFHIKEAPNSPSLKQLIDHLNNVLVPIAVLAVLLTSSTLLLLHIPLFLQEFARISTSCFSANRFLVALEGEFASVQLLPHS